MTLETGITFADARFIEGLTITKQTLDALQSKFTLTDKGAVLILSVVDSEIKFGVTPITSGEVCLGYKFLSMGLGEHESDWKSLFVEGDPDKTARIFKNRRLPSTVLEANFSPVICILSQTQGELHLNFFVDTTRRALRMIWKNGTCRLVDLFDARSL